MRMPEGRDRARASSRRRAAAGPPAAEAGPPPVLLKLVEEQIQHDRTQQPSLPCRGEGA